MCTFTGLDRGLEGHDGLTRPYWRHAYYWGNNLEYIVFGIFWLISNNESALQQFQWLPIIIIASYFKNI
jgi:hypothetical protein